jgi:tetratricopeptide (TPR) repeat protein
VGTAALYWPILGHDFISVDDPQYVNPALEDVLTPGGLRRTFTTAYLYNWHPLTTLSYAIDYRLSGNVAGGYLRTNLLLHACATTLLFLALERLTGASGRSAFVAAVFGVHPLHVESVAWVSERKDVLSGVLFAGLLLVYAGQAKERMTGARRVALFAVLALGLLAKPMLVTAPFVLLLLDFWPLGRIRCEGWRPALRAMGGLVCEKLPLFALAAASCIVTYLAQNAGGAVRSLHEAPLAARLLRIPVSYATYLERAFWPHGLALIYPALPGELSAPRVLAATLALGALTAGFFLLRRRAPYLLVGWLWFLGMLVPVIGLVQVSEESAADRYMYLPLIGLAMAVAWGAFDLFGSRRAAIGACALVPVLAVASAIQIRTWQDGVTVASRALAVTPDNALARLTLATALLQQRRVDEAQSQVETAIRLAPQRADYRAMLGQLLQGAGRVHEAVAAYDESLRLDPAQDEVRAILGDLLLLLGRPEEALGVLEKASAQSREARGPEIHVLMGRALERRGDLEGAAAQYRAALTLWPDFPEAHGNLGLLLARQNLFSDAESHLRRARSLGLEAPELHAALADTLLGGGRTREAVEELQRTVGMRPNWVAPANQLARILATDQDPAVRRPAEAVALAEGAVRATKREDPAVLETLALAYAADGRLADALATSREALALARTQHRDALAAILAERAQGYEVEGGHPVR